MNYNNLFDNHTNIHKVKVVGEQKYTVPPYIGPYNVTPSEETQTLETAGKKLESDVTIAATPLESKTLNVSDNGQYSVTPDEAVGLSEVEVNVDVQPELQTKSVEYTANGGYTVSPDDGYDALSQVNVSVNIQQVEVPENDVEFIDYDGTIVYSYTKEQFLSLTSMPANPTHTGLIAQGWNWSLTNAKSYVNENEGLVIGQMYITDDGKTRIYITISGNYSPYMRFVNNKPVIINWGDGSTDIAPITPSYGAPQAISHTYSMNGNYVVTFEPTDNGEIVLYGDSGVGNSSGIMCNNSTTISNNYLYYQTVNKIEIGRNCKIGNFGLYSLFNCKSITLPKGDCFWEFNGNAISYIFGNTTSLNAIVFPNEAIGKIGFRCFNLSSVKKVSISEDLPVFEYRNWFELSRNIEKVFLSPNVTKLTTSNATQNMLAINDYYLPSLKKISIPEGYTTIDSNFASSRIGLVSVIISSTVQTIQSAAFSNCRSLSYIKFKATIPPTISSSDTFSNLPTDCKIYVPQASLDAYKTATNYPNPNTYTYIGY